MRKNKYTDEQLIENIKSKAKEVGRSPYFKEVEGASVAVKRFRSWNNALKVAGLCANRSNEKFEAGTKIGLLTVVKDEVIDSRLYYHCTCQCGKDTLVRADSLKKDNKTLSCGCLSQLKYFKNKDITGRKYGRLLVLSFTGKGKGEQELWLCRCDCGNLIELTKKQLYSNTVKSCGCMAYESRITNVNKAIDKLKKEDLIEGTSILKISRQDLLKNNTSGYTGVTYDKNKKKWLAQIWFKGVHYYLGRYDSKDEAHEAYEKGKEKLHKEFLKSLNK